MAYSITHVNDMSEKDIKAIWYEPKDYKAFKNDSKESAILAKERRLGKKRKEKKNRWEGLAVCTRRSGPKVAVQDPASTKKPARRPGLGSRQYSDSILVRPRRRPPSPNSPTQLLTSAGGLGGGTATRNIHRWASSSMSCVNDEVTSPHANGVAASKSMTREDRRKLTQHLSDSMLAMPRRLISPKKEEASSDVDEAAVCDAESERHKGSRCSLLRKQLSDSALVKPRRGDRLLPLQRTAIEELEEDNISLLSFGSDEVESPSSQCDIFARRFSDSVLSIPQGYLMSPPRANAVIEDNEEDINEGSLRTMDLETDGIDYKDEKERSISIQDIEIHSCGSRTESQQLQQNDETSTSEAETETETETELRLSKAYFLERDLSMSFTNNKNSSPEDETVLGSQTKFLARCNDSLLLIHADGGSWAKNLRRQRSRETRNDHSDPLLRLRAQGVRGKSLSEQVRRNRSDSTLISVDVAPLKTRKQNPTTTPVGTTGPRMKSTNAAW